MEQSRVLAALAALANGTRLELVRALIGRGPAGMPAGEIARHLDVSASRLSFHLAQLEQAGLISGRRESRNVIYTVDTARMGHVIGYLLNDCCRSDPEVCACCAPDASSTPKAP
ncbi:MAG: helix-turn-helix transcriptional regulator [Rhodobacteraceae bacterium]|uniref:ArsR/SmtB family transcription factor n=1 Tax=Albidovulum sp. TaxID=1872424 RepID=UPI001D302D36|nr:helix-turn-helix transcriptional regulator [Paracoccaceae bacterium]MCC0047316.1 helix-turn-helix transcriptional regulator [Defluviimonas sp.]HPE27176.1 metalloregulator ArsR/SmtB family transcription factor [Albidovulum sp.]MCB2122927.1 helix-turn-helix transcriptional regulator [Paracoccaceae bacterium]MCB2132686.1 helix-turn-helix transcriptional regulator [Paracoccaceae bacterium]